MSNITFGTLPPSLTTQLRTNQKTSFFWEGMLPPVTWKMPENFVAKSCAGTKLWSSTAASAGESWKTGVYFKSDWRQFEDQADGFFFRKRLKLVSKWIQQCSPCNNLLGFMMLVWMKAWSCDWKDVALKRFCCFFLACMIQRCAYGCSVCGLS